MFLGILFALWVGFIHVVLSNLVNCDNQRLRHIVGTASGRPWPRNDMLRIINWHRDSGRALRVPTKYVTSQPRWGWAAPRPYDAGELSITTRKFRRAEALLPPSGFGY